MSCWNFAEAIFHLGEGGTAGWPALIHGEQRISYGELRRRALGIAAYLREQGLDASAHVGHYMRNSNAYLETAIGAGLAGMAHINVNYRYQDEELVDLCNGLDIQVLVYDAAFADRVARVRHLLEKTRVFIQVTGQSGEPTLESLYDWPVEHYQRTADGHDLLLIATGGTTGLPKGVMWRHEDLWFKQNVSTGAALEPLALAEPPATMAEHAANVLRRGPVPPFLTLSPLMHGAGMLMAIMFLAQGVPIATLEGEQFDADAALDSIPRLGVGSLVLVGDAFGRPLSEALERRPEQGLLDSLVMLISSGASLSPDVRETLLRHRPGLLILDMLGSTEASGYGVSTPEPGVFIPMPTTRVLDDKLREVEPGSETIGIAYTSGYLPQGYYKSPEETAKTFITIDGQRYVRTGDRCTVRSDGKLELLGRDSTVVNTGGEKVYTVEVERILLDHPAISDVVVVGLPHPRFGKQVTAVVEGPGLNQETLDVAALKAFATEKLADYKVPRLVYVVDSLRRAPNGKPDYDFVTRYAESCLAAEAD